MLQDQGRSGVQEQLARATTWMSSNRKNRELLDFFSMSGIHNPSGVRHTLWAPSVLVVVSVAAVVETNALNSPPPFDSR